MPACRCTARSRQRDRRVRRRWHSDYARCPDRRSPAHIDAYCGLGTGAERRRRPAVLRARPAGAEPGGRHRVLVVAGRGPPRVPEPARRANATLALAGGVNLILVAGGVTIACRRRRACWRPTAGARRSMRRADGYVRGEGCGVVVLQAALRCASPTATASSRVIRGSARESGRAQQRADGAERPRAGGGDRGRARRRAAWRRRHRLRRGARHRHVARRSDRGAGARRARSATGATRHGRCSSAPSRPTSATSRRRRASPG